MVPLRHPAPLHVLFYLRAHSNLTIDFATEVALVGVGVHVCCCYCCCWRLTRCPFLHFLPASALPWTSPVALGQLAIPSSAHYCHQVCHLHRLCFHCWLEHQPGNVGLLIDVQREGG